MLSITFRRERTSNRNRSIFRHFSTAIAAIIIGAPLVLSMIVFEQNLQSTTAFLLQRALLQEPCTAPVAVESLRHDILEKTLNSVVAHSNATESLNETGHGHSDATSILLTINKGAGSAGACDDAQKKELDDQITELERKVQAAEKSNSKEYNAVFVKNNVLEKELEAVHKEIAELERLTPGGSKAEKKEGESDSEEKDDDDKFLNWADICSPEEDRCNTDGGFKCIVGRTGEFRCSRGVKTGMGGDSCRFNRECKSKTCEGSNAEGSELGKYQERVTNGERH